MCKERREKKKEKETKKKQKKRERKLRIAEQEKTNDCESSARVCNVFCQTDCTRQERFGKYAS